MKVKPECPFGKYGDRMRIFCVKTGSLCGFQFYKSCKGWFANSPSWAECLRRETNETATSDAERL